MTDATIEEEKPGFKVEPDVPLPPDNRPHYPFASMKVGESFAFDKKLVARVRNNMTAHSKRHGGKFVCRQVGTDVWRCWRVE